MRQHGQRLSRQKSGQCKKEAGAVFYGGKALFGRQSGYGEGGTETERFVSSTGLSVPKRKKRSVDGLKTAKKGMVARWQ